MNITQMLSKCQFQRWVKERLCFKVFQETTGRDTQNEGKGHVVLTSGSCNRVSPQICFHDDDLSNILVLTLFNLTSMFVFSSLFSLNFLC